MTKYPIILVHGMALRDTKFTRAFGKIESKLSESGYPVYTANTDAFGSVENNAEQLKKIILEILGEANSEKINIIAHSKGGLDSKYMISELGMSERIASLTTLCTPHKGSPIASKIWKLPMWLKKYLAFFINGFYRVIGDKNPDALKVCEELQANDKKDIAFDNDVYCQSYSTILRNKKDCFLMAIPMKVFTKAGEPESDGLVSENSSKFGIYKGECLDESVSHTQIVDFFSKRKNRHKIFEFYIGLCKELEEAGY